MPKAVNTLEALMSTYSINSIIRTDSVILVNPDFTFQATVHSIGAYLPILQLAFLAFEIKCCNLKHQSIALSKYHGTSGHIY